MKCGWGSEWFWWASITTNNGVGQGLLDGWGDANEKEKMALVSNKIEEKGKLWMDPMVEFLWWSKEYSAPTKEIISLVQKIVELPGTILGDFVP